MIISELNTIKDIKLGDVDISKVYSGEDKVFEKENGYFYVYHSSTGLIERFPVTNSFNIVEKVTPGHIYGGYSTYTLYNDLYKVGGDYLKQIIDKQLSVEFTNNKLQDVNWHGYDGTATSVTDKDGNNIILLLAKKYYETTSGTNFSPKKDEIYYLLEIVKDYIDLCLVLVSDSIDNNIYNAFGIFGIINSARYSHVITNFEEHENHSFATSCTITYGVNGTNKEYTFKPSNISLKGYLVVAYIHAFGHSTGNVETPMLTEFNKDYTVTYEVTTLDGVKCFNKTYIFNKHDCSVDNPPTLIEQI